MKKLRIKGIRKSSGITLIALVITIIVLLILAGISISMLTGENRIVDKGRWCKDTNWGKKCKRESAIRSYAEALEMMEK